MVSDKTVQPPALWWQQSYNDGWTFSSVLCQLSDQYKCKTALILPEGNEITMPSSVSNAPSGRSRTNAVSVADLWPNLEGYRERRIDRFARPVKSPIMDAETERPMS